MDMSNEALIYLLFRSLRALTPTEVIRAYRRWLQEELIPHAEKTHDTVLLERYRMDLDMTPIV